MQQMTDKDEEKNESREEGREQSPREPYGYGSKPRTPVTFQSLLNRW